MIYELRESFYFELSNDELLKLHGDCESEEAVLAFDLCEHLIHSAMDQVRDNTVLDYMDTELRNLDGYYDGNDFYVDCVVTDNIIGELFNEALEIYSSGEAVNYDDMVIKYKDMVEHILGV